MEQSKEKDPPHVIIHAGNLWKWMIPKFKPVYSRGEFKSSLYDQKDAVEKGKLDSEEGEVETSKPGEEVAG